MEMHTIKGYSDFKDKWMRNMGQRKMLVEQEHPPSNEYNKGTVQNVCHKSL